jgi:hypothetical protein
MHRHREAALLIPSRKVAARCALGRALEKYRAARSATTRFASTFYRGRPLLSWKGSGIVAMSMQPPGIEAHRPSSCATAQVQVILARSACLGRVSIPAPPTFWPQSFAVRQDRAALPLVPKSESACPPRGDRSSSDQAPISAGLGDKAPTASPARLFLGSALPARPTPADNPERPRL